MQASSRIEITLWSALDPQGHEITTSQGCSPQFTHLWDYTIHIIEGAVQPESPLGVVGSPGGGVVLVSIR